MFKKKHPDKKIELVEEAVPYYSFFYDPENPQLYKHDRIGRCIDSNHTISNGQSTTHYKMSDILEEEGIEKIVLNTQSSIMLAKQKGMTFAKESTADYPIQFAEKNTQESYNQKMYMFVSQLMAWVDILKYSKIPELKLENYEYSDMSVKSRVNQKDAFKSTEISSYIEEIEAISNLFKQTDYLTDYQAISLSNNQSITINIPEEQKKFVHYIDKEKSQNLHMLEGISENDFENFESLTITPNQSLNDERVEIVIRKDYYDSEHIINEATGIKSGQYKQVLGITDEYIKKEVITVEMEDKADEPEVSEENSTSTTEPEVLEDSTANTTESEDLGDRLPDASESEIEPKKQLPKTGESRNKWYVCSGIFILMLSCFVMKMIAVSNSKN